MWRERFEKEWFLKEGWSLVKGDIILENVKGRVSKRVVKVGPLLGVYLQKTEGKGFKKSGLKKKLVLG